MPVQRKDPKDSSVRSSEDASLQASSYCPRTLITAGMGSPPLEPQTQFSGFRCWRSCHQYRDTEHSPTLRSLTTSSQEQRHQPYCLGQLSKSSHFLWPVLISVMENTIEQKVSIARTYTSSQPVFLP